MPAHFPFAIDSTMLSTFKSCPYKFWLQYCNHWKPKGESVHLIAGGAFASGLEATRKAFYHDGMSADDAVAVGLDKLTQKYGSFEPAFDTPKTLPRMLGALEYYFEMYPLINDTCPPLHLADGGRAIEFSFAIPFGNFTHPELGSPLMICGRADMIAQFAGGIWVVDEKTTSSLGNSWSRQWEQRAQFTCYSWAARQFGIEPVGVLVRGVSILKTKYETAQVLTRRADWEVERWRTLTLQLIEQMLAAFERVRAGTDPQIAFPLNLDHACAEYGGCPMLTVCKSRDPDEWLPTNYDQRVWDPLSHAETTLEAYNARFEK